MGEMIGTDVTPEMVISKEMKPVISKKLYQDDAKKLQPDVHVHRGKNIYRFLFIEMRC